MALRISKILCVLQLMYPLIVECEELTKSSWTDLEISSKIAGSMTYKHFLLDVYEIKQVDNSSKKFGYTPVVELDHESAVCQYHNLTRKYEVAFRISFWNNQLQKQVVEFLNHQLGQSIPSSDISVIHFDRVMLVNTDETELLTLKNKWENYRREKYLTFKMLTEGPDSCQTLSNLMKTNPSLFSSLQVQFSVSSKTSRSKAVTITASTISSGNFFSKLNQKFPSSEFVLLNSQDTNKLVQETVSNVAVSIVDDTGMVHPNSAIYDKLLAILVQSTEHSNSMDKFLWNSVFWNDDNARPDKVAETLNDVYSKSDTEGRQFLKNYFSTENEQEKNNSFSTGVNVGIKGFSVGVSYSESNGFRKKDSQSSQKETDEMFKFMDENKKNIQWRGEKFQPKSMELSRINMGNIRRKNNFNEVDTYISYATVGLSMSVVTGETISVRENVLSLHEDRIKVLEGMIALKCPTRIDSDVYCYQTKNPTTCYCMSHMRMNWNEAFDFCQHKGMNLVSIKSAEENAKLMEMISHAKVVQNDDNGIWTSGSNKDEKHKWIWKSTGDELAYTRWAKTEPNNLKNSEYYLQLGWSSFWSDENETKKNYALCEFGNNLISPIYNRFHLQKTNLEEKISSVRKSIDNVSSSVNEKLKILENKANQHSESISSISKQLIEIGLKANRSWKITEKCRFDATAINTGTSGSGNLYYLDRHHIWCKEDEYLNHFRFERVSGNDIRYNFRCCKLHLTLERARW